MKLINNEELRLPRPSYSEADTKQVTVIRWMLEDSLTVDIYNNRSSSWFGAPIVTGSPWALTNDGALGV